MLRNRLDIQLRNVCLIFRVYGWLQSLWTPGPPLHPPWKPWNIQLSQGTGQGVSTTFHADRSAALGSRRCELPGMHSVPKSAVLPYAFGVGGLSRRLLNRATPYVLAGRSWGRSASGDVFLQEIPTTGEDFQCPRPHPRKASCGTVLPNTPFQNPKSGC